LIDIPFGASQIHSQDYDGFFSVPITTCQINLALAKSIPRIMTAFEGVLLTKLPIYFGLSQANSKVVFFVKL